MVLMTPKYATAAGIDDPNTLPPNSKTATLEAESSKS